MTGEAGASARIVPFGERAWLLDLGDVIDEAVNARILAIADAIEERRRDGLDAVERPVVAYASLLLAFEPSRISAADVYRSLVDASEAAVPEPSAADRPPIEIPVRYGGDDGPDLESVAARLGLATEAVVALHTGTTYRVFMLGFAPGFAYLGTLPAELSLPRLAEPRTLVPAGKRRDRRPPDGRLSGRDARWLASDRPDRPAALGSSRGSAGTARPRRPRAIRGPLMLEVLEPGLQSTIQDAGRPGLAHLGLRRAGAADARALAACNLLVGNLADDAGPRDGAPGWDIRGPPGRRIGLAGADMEARVPEEGRTLAPGRAHRLSAGTTLVFAGALDGARTYLALAGGIQADLALGSASTDLTAGIGGLSGRALRVGDRLVPGRLSDDTLAATIWPSAIASSGIQGGAGPWVVAVTRGPHADADRGDAWSFDALVGRAWSVSPRSDRVGLRLDGDPLSAARAGRERAGDLVSIPMLPGADPGPAGRAADRAAGRCADRRRLPRAGGRHRGGPAGARPAPSRRRAALREHRPGHGAAAVGPGGRGPRARDPTPRIVVSAHPYRIRRSDRARYARLTVTEEGEAVVVLPRRAPLAAAAALVEAHAGWIERHVAAARAARGRLDERPPLEEGRILTVAGLEFRVSTVDPGRDRPARGRVEVSEATPGRQGRFVVRLGRDGRDTATLLGAWMRDRAHAIITDRTAVFAPALGVRPTRINGPGPADALGERRAVRRAVVQLASPPRTTRGAGCGRRPRARAPARPWSRPRVLDARRASRSPDAGRAPLAPRERPGAARRPRLAADLEMEAGERVGEDARLLRDVAHRVTRTGGRAEVLDSQREVVDAVAEKADGIGEVEVTGIEGVLAHVRERGLDA